jgi:PBP1b-binding outer membrane lipoprotein LpoB
MKKTIALLLLAFFLLGCTSSNSSDSNNQSPIDQNNPLPGSDRDEHGCIPSAGYSWCEAKQKCLRSWEEQCTTGAIDTNKDSLKKEEIKTQTSMQVVLNDLSNALKEMENLDSTLQK